MIGDERLRILFVTTSLIRGGAETQVFLLARGLALRGHHVHVVSMLDPEAHEADLAGVGVGVTSLLMRRGAPDPRALLRLARVVRQVRPDVVHSHMVHANLLARLARPLGWAPVLVSTAHNLVEGGRLRDLAYRLTDPLADLTTNVAQAAVDRFVRVGAVPRRRIRRMANGLDVGAFTDRAASRERLRSEFGIGNRFLWLSVGRLDPQKDYGVLLEAVAGSASAARGRAVWIVGAGPLASSLAARAVELGLDERSVRFLGARADVPDLMAAADGFVLSSAWEGLPMVLLEAAASSLPAVVTDVGGNREVVIDGRTGSIVPPHDPAALGAAMLLVEALDAIELAAWGRAARAHVEENFDLEHVLDQWEVLYRELLGTKTPSRGRA